MVGLGSMGKRRIRNLQFLKNDDIIGFDLREDRCSEASKKYKIKTWKATSKNNRTIRRFELVT